MKSKISISVVMACYNNEMFISYAIRSLLEQSYNLFELIIVNDNSTDNTEQEIKKFKDPRIRYFKNAKNLGNSSSWNLGISLAVGKYICMMDSNSIAPMNRLELQYEYLEKYTSIGLVGGSFEEIDQFGEVTNVIENPLDYESIKIWLLQKNCVQHSTIMMRNNLLTLYELSYNEGYKDASDYDFVLRASKLFPIVNIKEVLVQRRTQSYQLSPERKEEKNTLLNKIRIQQLGLFGLNVTEKEIELHLKITGGEYVRKLDMQACENWIKKLCLINNERKIYDINYFNNLSENLLNFIANNGLGGWSIEKELVEFISGVISKGSSILEFGSGNGTEALLENYSVTSIEHDIRYSFTRGENHECILAPIKNEWYNKDFVNEALMKKYNLIIIDGPPGELRNGILKNLNAFKTNNAPVIFDDINREVDKEIMMAFCRGLNYSHQVIIGGGKAFGFCTKKTLA